jgi:ribosome maturation factor RimP
MRLKPETLEEIRAIARRKGCRLLEVEPTGSGGSSVMRVVLERQDGSPVTIKECEGVSRDVSALLDSSDEIGHRYSLEVSSAGLDRKLYTIDDARRFVGRRVRVKTDEPVLPEPSRGKAAPAAGSRNLRGTLESVEGDVLRVVDGENRKTYNVCFGDIRQARLEFEWPERRG